MSTSLSSHEVSKKIFIHEENCQRENGERYAVINITYMAAGLQHTLVLFSDEEGMPEFIKTNKRLIPSSWFDEDYEGSYQDEDEENTDDNETG